MGGTRCQNCGEQTHKSWECPNAPNVTANIICTSCGSAGHIARDCKEGRPGGGGYFPGAAGPDNPLDEEVQFFDMQTYFFLLPENKT